MVDVEAIAEYLVLWSFQEISTVLSFYILTYVTNMLGVQK